MNIKQLKQNDIAFEPKVSTSNIVFPDGTSLENKNFATIKDLLNYYTKSITDSKFVKIEDFAAALDSKQNVLSDSDFKTINNESVFGEGNINIDTDTYWMKGNNKNSIISKSSDLFEKIIKAIDGVEFDYYTKAPYHLSTFAYLKGDFSELMNSFQEFDVTDEEALFLLFNCFHDVNVIVNGVEFPKQELYDFSSEEILVLLPEGMTFVSLPASGHFKIKLNISSGIGSVSINIGHASGDYSTAISGFSEGRASIALLGVASGEQSIAIGPNADAIGENSICISGGWETEASGRASVAIGNHGFAIGNDTIAIGGTSYNGISVGGESYDGISVGGESVGRYSVATSASNKERVYFYKDGFSIENNVISGTITQGSDFPKVNSFIECVINDVRYWWRVTDVVADDRFYTITIIPATIDAEDKVFQPIEDEIQYIINFHSNVTFGDYSFNAGLNSTAVGNNSIAIGTNCVAIGDDSFASGVETIANGIGSHTEGYHTITGGEYETNINTGVVGLDNPGSFAHVEGHGCIACGCIGAHAEGNKTLASGNVSHSEGSLTVASGDFSHTEGVRSVASNSCAHAEGSDTFASGFRSHAGGIYSTANGANSFAHGCRVYCNSVDGFALGCDSVSVDNNQPSYAFGTNWILRLFLNGDANSTVYTFERKPDDALGFSNDQFARILKQSYIRLDSNSLSVRIIDASFEDDVFTIVTEKTLSAENPLVLAQASTAGTIAYGKGSIAHRSHAIGDGSIAMARGCITKGTASVAIGNLLYTNNSYESAFGQFNKSNSGTRHSIGIGTAEDNRKNAFEITSNGLIFVYGVNGYDGTNPNTSASGNSIQASLMAQGHTVDGSLFGWQ